VVVHREMNNCLIGYTGGLMSALRVSEKVGEEAPETLRELGSPKGFPAKDN